jgi:signal transduction histidine kinase
VVSLSRRAGRLVPRVVAADVAFCCAGMLVGAHITFSAYGTTWANFMYPFTIIASIGIGLAFRRYLTVLALTLALVGSYILAMLAMHHDALWVILANAITYLPNTAVAWAVARQLRRSAVRLDQSHLETVANTAELARQRERLRHAGLLHDRVLQTLEVLASGPWLADLEIRAHVAAEAAWLRAFVQGQDGAAPGDLRTALLEVAQRHIRLGMRIELNAAGLSAGDGTRQCEPPVVLALAQATHEALTNIRKHAGTDEATLFAAVTGEQVIVSVVDKGCGFDPATTPRGVGLGHSITEALQAVGGSATVRSAPGEGTSVEFSVGLRTPAPSS